MKFPVLWSGITHSVLGAPVNSTNYIKKKIVNCAIKQSGKSPQFEYIHIENALYKYFLYINTFVTFFSCKNLWFIQIFIRSPPPNSPLNGRHFFKVWMEPFGISSLPPWDQYFAIYRLLSPVFTGLNPSE